MINIYEATETDFNNNGLAVLNQCIKAEITEELNGIYELDLEYPLFNNNKWQYLVEDNILKVPTPKGNQLFRIKNKSKNFSSISVYAKHIFYDLLDNFIENLTIDSITYSSALALLFSSTQYSHNFHVNSDITNNISTTFKRQNPVDCLLNSNGFIPTFGGEILRDNYNITVNGAIGEDRGYTILYGKNMTGIDDKSDYNSIFTRIMPVGRDENGNDLLLPEKYIDSPLINNYPHPKITSKDYSDIKVNSNSSNGDIITMDDVYTKLREQVNLLFSESNVDKPVLDITVDFVELSKTEEYKDYSILQQIYLGDIVTVKHSRIGIDLKVKVTKYIYDAILQKYTTINLAGVTATGTTTNILADDIHNVKLSVDEVVEISNKIKNALGGYVVKRQNEILIMDTPDISTATKVWRWDINGLGYSSTGYNGTFGTAITMDGEIVADFIKTGELDATLIKAGVISSKDGTFKLSLDSGKFTTYALDTKYKALELYNRTISFYDFVTANKAIGCIQSVRQNNNTIPGIEFQAQPSCYVGFGKINNDGSMNTMVEYSNNAYSDGDKFYVKCPVEFDGDIYTGSSKGLTKFITYYDGSAYHTFTVINGLITDWG